ncbi:PQQ-dependent sugar dehydrogenase [Chryseolinea sp. H1M3-3]|uniref:PQQ-dependent sugar dehydrogenase n=1 Tax=Chryseolinea sp. H1M3-3 TaxID=3034144 RepID=UPI0023EC3A81|nr:PQQ-dependent sugar dehydrogenase [Chryseolinea sp. H1M3-3]
MKRNLKSSTLNMHIASACSVLFICLCLVSCDEWFDDDDDGLNDFNGQVYADHLDTPWELEFAPDGRLFFTQRPGVVSVIENGKTNVWLKLDSVVAEIGESGLLGVTLHPDFAQNGYVYVGYTYAASKSPLKLVNKLVRYKEDPATKAPMFDMVVMDGIAGNYVHNSGPLEFGPDGKLYWAIGEIFSPELAQDMNVLNGKILRMNDNGSIPSDNPFPASYIYSLGHRNPQGLAFHPENGALWSTEHGPSEEQGCCMDEINLIKPTANYGWPIIRGSQTQAGLETPVYHSGDTTTWAPTGGIFVTQGDWKGSFIFTGLRGQALYRATIDPNDATKIQKVDRYLYQKFGRLRNVVEGADGKLYIAVSNQDGRGDPKTQDDRIIILTQKQIEKNN